MKTHNFFTVTVGLRRIHRKSLGFYPFVTFQPGAERFDFAHPTQFSKGYGFGRKVLRGTPRLRRKLPLSMGYSTKVTCTLFESLKDRKSVV